MSTQRALSVDEGSRKIKAPSWSISGVEKASFHRRPQAGTRKRELCRREPKGKSLKLVDFGSRNGVLPPGNASGKVGGNAPPSLLTGFPSGQDFGRILVGKASYSLTKLCLEEFLLSNLKGRAMAHTPKLKPKAKNKIRRICWSKIHRILFGDQ